jgi:hypothetical protein
MSKQLNILFFTWGGGGGGGWNMWKKQFCHFWTNFRKLLKIVFFLIIDSTFLFFLGKIFPNFNIMKLEGK